MAGEATRKQLGATIRRNFRSLNGYYIAGGVMTGIAQMSFFGAVLFTQVSYVSVVAATEPVVTVLLSRLLLKKEEGITWHVVLTACAVFIGTVVLVLAG
jgi:drug/metabolite transporter (DMT)-like permease